ncbi:hypothetical protein GE061_002799 [Apolygus lucorum]|uniref:Uncharacterized protein n=1 Tax=Apolygus lucorum TaxID=248454 RepID=A0A8S9X7Y4_APOLU|nr:hypothetical protein GE061_002799 [Apolygus lucorum]
METQVRTKEDLSKEGGADDDEAPQCKALARLDTFDERYETFRRWPKVLHHLVNELASAGFHYSGQQGDLVYCYACEGGIQDWEMQDDPWVHMCRTLKDQRMSLLKKDVNEILANYEVDSALTILDDEGSDTLIISIALTHKEVVIIKMSPALTPVRDDGRSEVWLEAGEKKKNEVLNSVN